MKIQISDNSDTSWESYGKSEPYYGVLTDDKYRRNKLNDEVLAEFFQTGEAHIDYTLGLAEKHFPDTLQYSTALDFGCGVGRLVIPLARRFHQVVGVDISESYLAEASVNCARAAISNVEFLTTLDALEARRNSFDFVHSYITFIHIDFARGKKLIEEIVRLLRPGGVAALHIMFQRDIGHAHRAANRLRTKFLPANWMANIVRGRAAFEPLMQANVYSLDLLFSALHPLGVKNGHIEVAQSDGNWHAYLFVRKS